MKRAVAVIALAVLVACSDNTEEPAGSSEPTTTSTTATTPTTEVAATPLERPQPVDVAGIAVTGRAVETAERLAMDALAADDRWVYARREEGVVEVIDPETMALVREVDLGSHEGQGLGAGFGAVWAGSSEGIARIDPEAGTVVTTIELVKVRDQLDVLTAFDRVWVLVDDGTTLVGIDPATDEVATELELPVRGIDVAAGAASLWVASSVDDRVVEVDPTTGEVATTVAVEEPRHVEVGDDRLWVGTTFGVHALDLEGAELGSVGAGPLRDGEISLAEDGALWVRSARSVLHRVEPSTFEVTERVDLPLTLGGDVLDAFGWIWATDYDEAEPLLFRVRA